VTRDSAVVRREKRMDMDKDGSGAVDEKKGKRGGYNQHHRSRNYRSQKLKLECHHMQSRGERESRREKAGFDEAIGRSVEFGTGGARKGLVRGGKGGFRWLRTVRTGP